MIFRKLQMRNVRSHEDSTINFSDGFNCVVGGVGAGKTSILLTLHFAFYGEPLYRSYEYLMRENKNRAYISVEFEQSNKKYKINRSLKRERGKITQDSDELRLFEGEKLIAWGKTAAVQEHLQLLTGLDKKMYEEFIWIQQEKLKSILNMTPKQRQEILDDFFGFADFKNASDRLLHYQRHYEGKISALKDDTEVSNLPNYRIHYDAADSESNKIQAELETLKADLKEAQKGLQKEVTKSFEWLK